MGLVEASRLAGMLIKYEEDFILCSKIEEAMGVFSNNNTSLISKKNKETNTKKLYEINI